MGVTGQLALDVSEATSSMLSGTPSTLFAWWRSPVSKRREPHVPDHHIALTIKSTAETLPDEDFNTSNKVEKILEDALKKLPLDKNPPAPYKVVREKTDKPLPLDEKIADTGLASGEVVVIQAGQPIDG